MSRSITPRRAQWCTAVVPIIYLVSIHLIHDCIAHIYHTPLKPDHLTNRPSSQPGLPFDVHMQGYKHGCKTPACADAGLCACSSGDGPAVPIAAVASSNPPPGTEGSTGKPSTVEAVGGEGVGAENTAVAAAAAAPPPPA